MVECLKGLYVVTAQNRSGDTADRFAAELSDTRFHGLRPAVRIDNVSRSMPFDKTSLKPITEAVTPPSDVIKPLSCASSIGRQSPSHSSLVV